MISLRLAALVTLLVLVTPAPDAVAAILEREFQYAADRVTTRDLAGVTEVRARGGEQEFRAGHPDLPWVLERVALQPGQRVISVEVVELRTAPLARAIRVDPSIAVQPGLEPQPRSAPDAAVYASTSFLPQQPVELGLQGAQRDDWMAWIKVCPVRWNPASGALERVTSVRVRLNVADGAAPVLSRERRNRPRLEGAATGSPRLEHEGAPVRQAQPFRPTQIPSLEGSPVQYVIVTNDAQEAEYQRLADWKTRSGVPAVVRTLSWINQEYPFGADNGERIRMFLRDAYTRWGTDYVLLGGDTEVIPTRYAYTTYYEVDGHYIPSDLYYSCLDGNWNADGDSIYGEGYGNASVTGDSCDLMPEVYVGRAPTVTAADAAQFVDKTFMYTRTPVGDYEKSLLFFAEVLFPQNWTTGMTTWLDGAELIEFDLLDVFDQRPDLRYARLYENHLDGRWRPGAHLETRQIVRDSLDRGYNVAVHVGHGYRNVMSVGDQNLTNSDALALTNGDRLMNLYATNCTSNAIDFPSIGEAYLRAPNGGAVTNIGSTTLDFPYAARAYQENYFELLYRDSVSTIGEAQAKQKFEYIAYSSTDNVHRWTQMTLLLLGDPQLQVWTGTPRTLAVAHPASIAASDSQFSVTVSIAAVPLAGAKVTAWKPGSEYRIVTTNMAGQAVVPFRPDSTGSLMLTVTGYDCRPYQANVAITAAAAPVLAAGAVGIVENGTGGTTGNADGQLDEAEVADLRIPVLNTGGSAAGAVEGTLTTGDPYVTVIQNSVSYGSVSSNGTSNPAPGFRVSVVAGAPDQHEAAFTLTLLSGGVRTVRTFELVIHAPEPRQITHAISDVGVDFDGRPDVGETIFYTLTVKNYGSGEAQNVTAILRNHDGLATVLDSTASFGNLTSKQTGTGDALTIYVDDLAARLELRLSSDGVLLHTQTLDLIYPAPPEAIVTAGAATNIKLQWHKSLSPDLTGYNIYRSTAPGGPFAPVNPVPTERTSYYEDGGLSSLTRYYYKVTAVDSSHNESVASAVVTVSTNPPLHAIFPIPMGRETPSSVALDHLYPGYPIDIVAGADKVYVWHHDGSSPVDADGGGSTSGDFSVRGAYFAASPAIGDLDNDGVPEIVAASWDSLKVYSFDLLGNVRPGWPIPSSDAVWSSPALGDLDNDGKLEAVWASNNQSFYAVRENGQELLNGDGNAGTNGVFKVLGSFYNFGTPAIADLDGNGVNDIVFGASDGNLYAWRVDGTSLPGFPVALPSSMTGSVAIGYLDGPGDTQLDIAVPVANDSLYVIRANGSRRPGFPRRVIVTGTSRSPSPALADMNNDGLLDIVQASTNGRIYVWDGSGTALPLWNGVPYSALTGYATESSPVVADINGDGWNDVVMGDEDRQLMALSGSDAQPLPGFPIFLSGEVRGSPGLCDCDGDGKTEIAFSGWDKNLYVWDYDYPFSPNGQPPWPQFHHDARRTGYAGNAAFVDVNDDPPAVTHPAELSFAAPWPNPARRGARFQLVLPAEAAGQPYQLGVFDLAGRLVRTVAAGVGRPGPLSLEWNLRGTDGSPVGEGVYFVRFSMPGRSLSQKLVILR